MHAIKEVDLTANLFLHCIKIIAKALAGNGGGGDWRDLATTNSNKKNKKL